MINKTNEAKSNKVEKNVVFMMGLPAAGKSTWRKSSEYSHFAVVDCDEYKEAHPDYDPKNLTMALHVESKAWSEEKFHSHIENDDDFIYDGTGTNAESLVRRINATKEAGYKTTLVYISVSLETSLARNAARDRFVPEYIIREKALDVTTSFDIVKNFVDIVTVIDNED
jgi:predicted kinase